MKCTLLSLRGVPNCNRDDVAIPRFGCIRDGRLRWPHWPVLIVLAFSLFSCSGGSRQNDNVRTTDLLPGQISDAGLKRSSAARLYVGDSLWAYIDGGAELYYSYNFVEVATADYSGDGVEFVADLYKFDSPTDAYGLYSMVRSADVTLLEIGTEGSLAPGQLQFVKGQFMARLTAFDDAEKTVLALTAFAEKLAQDIPGASERPAAFALFPDSARVVPSDRYHAESFLQEKFLTNIFASAYFLDGDTVTLFLSMNNPGQKILAWSKLAEQDSILSHVPDDLPFDDGKGFIVAHKLYGTIIVGMKNNRMAGMVGYRESLKPFLTQWLASLPK